MLRYSGITYEEILKDSDTYLDLLLTEKAIGFSGLYLEPDQIADFMGSLYKGYTRMDRGPSVAIYPNKNGDQINPAFLGEPCKWDPLEVANKNWHADTLEQPTITTHIGLSMVHYDCPEPDKGQTVFVDVEKLYELLLLETPYKDYVENLWCAHATHNCDMGVNFSSHPFLRTHPVTGRTGLHLSARKMVPEGFPVPGPTTDFYDEHKNTTPEFEGLMEWLWNHVHDDGMWDWWRWEEGDFLLWDNRCFVHSFTGGWDIGDRVFHRALVGDEVPFYKPPIDGVGPPGLLEPHEEPIRQWSNNDEHRL
jgi:alpha-ketoglutarate-dependent taurine dioxygenase